MAFYTRLYICSALKSLLRARVHVKHVFFSSHSFSYKDLHAKGSSDWEGGAFLRSGEHWTLREWHRSFGTVAPSWNIMFVYHWRECFLLIHWLALLQRLKEFDFRFIYSRHFSSCGREVFCVIPQRKLPSSSPPSSVKWDYKENGKQEIEDKGHNKAVIHCNHASLGVTFSFHLHNMSLCQLINEYIWAISTSSKTQPSLKLFFFSVGLKLSIICKVVVKV